MFNAIGKILLWLRDGGLKLLVFALLLLLLWGTFAPLPIIVRWLDRGEDNLERKTRQLSNQMNSDRANPQASATQNRLLLGAMLMAVCWV
jgi:hypothetical protein